MSGAAASTGAASPATGSPRVIALVGPLPPPAGGMANQTRQLARLLAESGCSVELVRNNEAYRPAWVGRVQGLRALFRLPPYLCALWRAAGRADVMHVMANSGWAWHFFAAPAVWIGALRGTPVLINYRGGDAERFFERQAGLVRATVARARLVVVPSGFLAEVFARFGMPATIVPNIVDLARFAPAPQPPARPRLLVTRNLERIYDIGTAIRAFAILRRSHPGATLAIAGEGPERASLEALVQELGLAGAVEFLGRRDNAELPALYAGASAMVNPSRVDNMPISILEALASAVPVVSTRVGGVPFMVEDGRDALLVPPGDAEAMAAALRRVHDDPVLAAALRERGLATARQYAWSQVRPQLFAAYASACAQRRGAIA